MNIAASRDLRLEAGGQGELAAIGALALGVGDGGALAVTARDVTLLGNSGIIAGTTATGRSGAVTLRARGDNWFPTASHLVAYAFVMPCLGYWLSEVRGWGVEGLMTSILVASWVSFGVLGARLGALRGALPPKARA